jgi:hypothetical protein
MSMAGHNNPPSPIETTHDALADLRAYLIDNPVIQTGIQAKQGSLLVERTRKLFQDIEDARKAEVGPLNEQVKTINSRYRDARGPLESVLTELCVRLNLFTVREEERRRQEADEKRLAAEALEMEARRAEEAEREAKQNATMGEIVDVADRIVEADQAFSRFQKAERAAAVAERDTHVRLPSQLGGKALSLRSKETLTVDNALKAMSEIGSHPKINESILVAAREYRKRFGRLPAGVSASHTRSI